MPRNAVWWITCGVSISPEPLNWRVWFSYLQVWSHIQPLSRGDWVQTNRTDFTIPDNRVSGFTKAFEISYYSFSMSFWSVCKTLLYLKNHNNSLRKGDLWVYAVRSGSRSVFHCSNQHPAMIHHSSSSEARRSFSRAIFIHPSSRNVFNFLLFRIVLLRFCQIYYHQT